jgi:hypothetical protein
MVLPKQEKTLTAYFRVNNQMTTIDLAKSVNDFNWSINGRYLYYYSGKNIKHYDWDRQRETAVNLESDIQKLNWFFDENHYLVSTEKGVFEIDLDNTNRIEFTTKNSTFYQDPRLTSLIFKEDNVFKKFSGNF